MNLLVYLCYPLLAVFLFWGAKVYKRNEWNTEFLSLSQTKALQGFCAVAIMLHHIGQKTCAPWLNPKVIVHGLDVFVPIGYWFVGIFVFCSGYGLYKSYKEKPDYLKGFFTRRVLPLFLAFAATSFCFQFARGQRDVHISFLSSPIQVGGPDLANPYAWYVLMLPVMYLGFYLGFRYCKNDKTAILVTCIVGIAYIAHCDFWMYGSWWYNAVPLFIIGMMIAKYEKEVIANWRGHYLLYLIMAMILAVTFHMLAENPYRFFSFLAKHESFRWIRALSQMVSCIFFTVAVFLAGMKIKVGNKALAFMGTITLEFYLIHGLFVQLFGYCFIVDLAVPLYYIKNVALLVLVVLVLAVPSAFLLHKLIELAIRLLKKQKVLIAVMKRDAKKLLVIALALICLITVVLMVSARSTSNQAAEEFETYSRDVITYADVDGEKMAAYITGEGENTIVMLRSIENPCPTVTLKPIADDLAKNNHVIILDYFGCGFSDDTDRERDTDHFVYEIHTALDNLGEKGPFILMPMGISAVYAKLYYDQYPQEVKAIVGINGSVAEQLREMMKVNKMNEGDYRRSERKNAKKKGLEQVLIRTCGYTELQWPLYESLFYHTHTRTELSVMRELMVRKLYSRNTVEEMMNEFDNTMKILGQKYAKELPVRMILDFDSCNVQWLENENNYLLNPNLDWQMLHEKQFSNPDIQEIQIMSGDPYLIYYNPHSVSKVVQDYLDQLN